MLRKLNDRPGADKPRRPLKDGVSPFEKSERLARGLHSTAQGMPARKAPGQNGKSFPSR